MENEDGREKIKSFQEARDRRLREGTETRAKIEARLVLIKEQVLLLAERAGRLNAELNQVRTSLDGLNGEYRIGQEMLSSPEIDTERLHRFLEQTSELEE